MQNHKKIPDTKATTKGCALLAAIDAGILPETEDGYDTAPFERFWSLFMENVRAHAGAD